MTAKRKTRAELEAVLADALALVEKRTIELGQERNSVSAITGANLGLRKSIDDLKERLANAESENQRMRGYLARVQEDDIVREELIAVGDPSGETRLVPKRKPTVFHQPSSYRDQGCDSAMMAYDRGATRAAPKHWVTY